MDTEWLASTTVNLRRKQRAGSIGLEYETVAEFQNRHLVT